MQTQGSPGDTPFSDSGTPPSEAQLPVPPSPTKRPHSLTAHGDTRIDPWYWLRDKHDPAVIAHLESENAYTAQVMAKTTALQERLYAEIVARILETDLSVPVLDGPWYYYSRTVEGLQYPIHCRRPAPTGNNGRRVRPGPAPGFEDGGAPFVPPPPAAPPDDEAVILDENALAGTSEYFALGAFDVSPDHRLVAFSIDLNGDELYEMWVKDIASDAVVDGPIRDTYYGTAWSTDGSVLFYTRTDDAMRPYQLWRHLLGTDPSDDALVYEESDQRFNLSVGMTKDESMVVVELESRTTTETWVVDAADPMNELRLVLPRREGIEHSVEHARGQFLILTNDGAADFRLVMAPVDDPDPSRWVEVLPHRPGTRLEGFEVFDDYLVILERVDACARMTVLPAVNRAVAPPWDIDAAVPLPAPEQVSTTWDSANPEMHSTFLRYEYSSLVTPRSLFDFDMSSGEQTFLKSQLVLGGYDPSLYATERIWTDSGGVQVPISIVYRRSTEFPAPCLLYGYGSYEASMDPVFSSVRLSLLDRGFVFAIAHVRGGGEMGRHWYEDGKLLFKKHTFEDFVACGRDLVNAGLTSPDRLVARGGSAGGLLMGAVANAAPELFAAIVAEVPFVDCLTTILDETLPLTVNEWEEWGNPVTDPDVYAYMKSYSPYDNVRDDQSYPRILATAGLNDPRVSYWEPAKWVARLREADPSNQVLLKVEMGAGHQGPSGRYDAWRDEAFVLAFILDALGLG